MRKAALFFLLLTAFSFPVQAAQMEPTGTPLRKLQRGFLNIALSPVEISTELAREKNRDTFPMSWMLGAARGTFYVMGRALTGVYEIVTFPIPLPAEYAPILEPEFPYQHLEDKSSEAENPKE